MAKMKVLKPELDEIKERVGEDMTKVQQEQMKLYSAGWRQSDQWMYSCVVTDADPFCDVLSFPGQH